MEPDIEITEIPHGRRLVPKGSIFALTASKVSQMTDSELRSFIAVLRDEVRDAERYADQKAINLSQATTELSFREETLRRHLRNFKLPKGVTKKPKQLKLELAKENPRRAFDAAIENWRKQGKTDKEIYDILAKIQMNVGKNGQ